MAPYSWSWAFDFSRYFVRVTTCPLRLEIGGGRSFPYAPKNVRRGLGSPSCFKGIIGSVAGAQGPLPSPPKKCWGDRTYPVSLSLLAGDTPSTERGRTLIGRLMRPPTDIT